MGLFRHGGAQTLTLVALGLRRNRLEKQLREFGYWAMEGENEGQEARITNSLCGHWVDGGAEWGRGRGLAGRRWSSVELEAEGKRCAWLAVCGCEASGLEMRATCISIQIVVELRSEWNDQGRV